MQPQRPVPHQHVFLYQVIVLWILSSVGYYELVEEGERERGREMRGGGRERGKNNLFHEISGVHLMDGGVRETRKPGCGMPGLR